MTKTCIILCFLLSILTGCAIGGRPQAESPVAADYRPEPIFYHGEGTDKMPKLSGTVVSRTEVDDFTVTVYEKSKPSHDRYGAYITFDGDEYYLGESNGEDFRVVRTPYTTYNGNPIYSYFHDNRAAASYGTTYFWEFYDYSSGKMPVECFRIEGSLSFYDLDGDGTPEIIATQHCTLFPNVHVVFLKKDRGTGADAEKIDVNMALGAVRSFYDNDGVFEVQRHIDNKYNESNLPVVSEPERCMYKDGAFVRVD